MESHALPLEHVGTPEPRTLEPRATEPELASVAGEAARRRARGWRDALLRRLLALADLLAVVLAAAAVLVGGHPANQLLWCFLCAPLCLVVAKLQGLYDQDQRSLRHLTADELPNLALWVMEVTAGLVLLFALVDGWALSVADAALFAVLASCFVCVFRVSARRVWRRITPPERTAVFGTGKSVADIRRKLELFDDIHVDIVAECGGLTPADVCGQRPSLLSLDRFIVAPVHADERMIRELLQLCRRRHIKLSLVPPGRGAFGSAAQLTHIADLPVVEYDTWDIPRSTLRLKRLVDVVICALLIPVFVPLFAVVALAIRLDGPGPIVFTQTRAGLGGTPFRMYKFRTMVCEAEVLLTSLITIDELPEPVFKLVNDPRVTRVGRVLRRWSLDELPQLLNVLRGEMSLVGPRPEQVEIVERYGPEHRFRLLVKPGLTGPMQVFGRGNLSFEERLAVEREYVDSVSLGRDFRLLAMTIAVVVGGRGAL